MVVLYRSAAASRCLLEKLLAAHLPVIVIGTKELLYDHPALQPALACFRLALVPDDQQSLTRILPILGLQHQQIDSRLLDLGLYGLLSLPGLAEETAEHLRKWILLLSRLPSLPPTEAVHQFRMAGYNHSPGLDDPDSLTETKAVFDAFETSADQYSSLPVFLSSIDELRLRLKAMKALVKDPTADALRLMSIHAAKGLEFDTIFLIGCCEGILPHTGIRSAIVDDSGRIARRRAPPIVCCCNAGKTPIVY